MTHLCLHTLVKRHGLTRDLLSGKKYHQSCACTARNPVTKRILCRKILSNVLCKSDFEANFATHFSVFSGQWDLHPSQKFFKKEKRVKHAGSGF
jgi:hypothetical protein